MIRICWNNLTPPGYGQDDILKFLLIPAVFHNPELKNKMESSSFYWKKSKKEKLPFPTYLEKEKTAKTRLFSYKPESATIQERMLNLLLLKTENKGKPYTMDTFPVRQAFKKQWQLILTPLSEAQKNELTPDKSGIYYTKDDRRLLSANEVSAFKSYIRLFWTEKTTAEDFEECLSKWKSSKRNKHIEDVNATFKYNDHEIRLDHLLNSIVSYDTSSVLQSSEEDPIFYERLATMSVIACIWYLWENAEHKTKYAEQMIRLSKMVFPMDFIDKLIPEESCTITEEDSSKKRENEDTLKAEEKLKEIKALISSKEYSKAGSLCEEIFEIYKFASDHAIGMALAYLVQCCENGYKRPSKFATIDDIKKEAISRQCVYISKTRQTIKAEPKKSSISFDGCYTLNCDNPIAKYIQDTAPNAWKVRISSIPENTLRPNTRQRMLLVSDDYAINMQDTLNILDSIKKSIDAKKTMISDWGQLEVFIRCNEDEITPLLDTALSYFTENTEQGYLDLLPLIKIYLIDEAKRSAGYLFAKHPHFYPLTLPRNLADEKKTIHLVIVSNNPDHRYAKWLIKEGFWTLPRFDQKISTKITVISPYASEIGYSIISECEGLEGFSTIDEEKAGEAIEIEGIPFPSINFKQTSFSNRSLHNELRKTFASDDYLYYVVDADSDFKGIQLGTTIRELSIRKAVSSGRIKRYSKMDHIIAIRCQHPDYAALTQGLIIPKENEHANQWFNDYNFITWGSMEDVYAWDQLNGGIIETLAQCIHLQYCESSFDKDDCKRNLSSYFRRLYNHDSSFAASLSLPYRLFEAGLFPSKWAIQNPDAYWDETTRRHLAESYRKKLSSFSNNKEDNAFVKHLAQYEHMRWCCYELTRGWLPVNDNQQVIQYMLSGASRPSLQIAKLHPCICSWNELLFLHKSLSDAATRNISSTDYEDFFALKEESTQTFKEAIESYLVKKFKPFFSADEDYTRFQRIDYKNIEQTADILENKWQPDMLYDHDEKLK